jgi:site-specific recombinase XerD
MGAPEVTAFLTSLAVQDKVAASTQNQALSALLFFLYRDVLGVDLPWLEDVVRAKRPQYLPMVLTRDETRAVLQRLSGVSRIRALLLYGTGLRLLECKRDSVSQSNASPTARRKMEVRRRVPCETSSRR